jgi:hypothetical protein
MSKSFFEDAIGQKIDTDEPLVKVPVYVPFNEVEMALSTLEQQEQELIIALQKNVLGKW